MILEGIVTSLNSQGNLNIAPMGPIVDESLTWLHLRPFQTSTTFRNLKESGCGVFHVVDDVLLIAQAALNRLPEHVPTRPASEIAGQVLESACRWHEFRVETLDDSQDRSEIRCRVVHTGRLRDFFGFQRAKHAVLEATILATRLHLISREEIATRLADLRIIVGKTAGPREFEAMELVEEFVRHEYERGSTLTPSSSPGGRGEPETKR
jgi:hypothetical protein